MTRRRSAQQNRTRDEDDDFADAALPEVFTRADEASAAAAGAQLQDLYRRISALHGELELIERGLREPAKHSARHAETREWARHALVGF